MRNLPDAKLRSTSADLACVRHSAQIARGPLEYSPVISPDPIFAAAAPYELVQLRWPEPQGPDRVLNLHLLWWKGHLADTFRGSRVLLRNTMAGKNWSVCTAPEMCRYLQNVMDYRATACRKFTEMSLCLLLRAPEATRGYRVPCAVWSGI